MRGNPKMEFIYKKIYICSYIFKPVTFKVLSIGCNTSMETFFPLLETVFELVHFDAF